MADLSIAIPARKEMFLRKTIENILANAKGDTEVIAVLDGDWPEPNIIDHPKVILVHHSVSIGQRAGTNEAAKISQAPFFMKCDAHCAFDEGFDVKLMEPYKTGEIGMDVTTIPRMYNLHAFDWVCKACGNHSYQGPTLTKCLKCEGPGPFEREIFWQPRLHRCTDFARFDKTLHFQYWRDYKRRPEAQGDIADVMCSIGACWMMPRERFWELGGMDEAHGSWGQMGVEIACKSWLSGGRQVVNKRTWFSHMFRTQGKDFGFPYPIKERDIQAAREYSRDIWMNNKWAKAIKPLSWIIEHFAPVPDWMV